MLHFSTILVPIDFSQRSRTAVQYASKLADQFKTDVVTVHAHAQGMEGRHDRMPAPNVREHIDQPGEPENVIPRVALQIDAEAIVVCGRGLRPLHNLFRPSVTAELIRRAHCPVIVCPESRDTVATRPIKNVLCATALGPASDRIVRWAARLSRSIGADLAVAHADGQLPLPGYPCEVEWRSWVRQSAREELKRTINDAGAHCADVWLESGRPAPAIARLADQVRADLIVVGRSPATRGFGPSRMKCLQIASEAICPVAVV
jgi:nucleotide-binding universal stress UspA family protein